MIFVDLTDFRLLDQFQWDGNEIEVRLFCLSHHVEYKYSVFKKWIIKYVRKDALSLLTKWPYAQSESEYNRFAFYR